MESRSDVLDALMRSELDLEGPYIGATLAQVAKRLDAKRYGDLCSDLRSLVDDGAMHELFEPRVGFEKSRVGPIRTYRLAGIGYAHAQSIRFTTPAEQRF